MAKLSTPKILLHIEGLAMFALATGFYFHLKGAWWMYLVLLLSPDVGFIGYLISKRIGGIMYNMFHTYTIPLLILGISLLNEIEIGILISLIWCAHIGLDRIFGYGLKYPGKNPKKNHLTKI